MSFGSSNSVFTAIFVQSSSSQLHFFWTKNMFFIFFLRAFDRLIISEPNDLGNGVSSESTLLSL